MNYYNDRAAQVAYYDMILTAGGFVAYRNAILRENLPGGYEVRYNTSALEYNAWEHRNKLLEG
jgi:hypothetical protein